VADLALLREPCRDVIRVGRALEVLQVAPYAGRARQVIVPIHVTQRALHLGMRPAQRKPRLRMIERCRLPSRGRMADLALLGHPSRQMVGVGRALIILQVTRDARRSGQVEIASLVALVALQLRMPACKRESHCIVIETRRLPSGRRMAFLAGLRKAKRHVIRIARFLKIG